MSGVRSSGRRKLVGLTATTLLLAGWGAWAQDQHSERPKSSPAPTAKQAETTRKGDGKSAQSTTASDSKAKSKTKRKGQLAAGGVPPKKDRNDAADPLAKRQDPMTLPDWPYFFRLKLMGGDETPRGATYFPAKTKFTAPVILLIHETGAGRSGKDFLEPIDDLKGESLAGHLQEKGFAVLVLDLRGHGVNPRVPSNPKDWQVHVADLQATYYFLIDRHNRGEFNLAKLGVIAIGDASNLVLEWAATPGGAVASEGRTTDLAAIALISPVKEAHGLQLLPLVQRVAPRVPLLVASGQRDPHSSPAVQAIQGVVERQRTGRIAPFDSSLHGYKLVQFYPKVVETIAKFLDDPVKFKINEWEPRYLFDPSAYQAESVTPTKSIAKPKSETAANAAEGGAGDTKRDRAKAEPSKQKSAPPNAKPKADEPAKP